MWVDEAGRQQQGVKKASYTHEAMADLILAHPAITQAELAGHFGYTEGWISQIIASDAFQAYLATRKEQILDPVLRGHVEEAFKGLVLQSIGRLRNKLEANPSDQLVLEVFKNASRALGYGSRVQVDATVKHTHTLMAVLQSLPAADRVIEATPIPQPLTEAA